MTGLDLFLPTMQNFIAHRTRVYVTLGASPVTLKDGYTVDAFADDRAAVQAAMDTAIPV